MAANNSQFDVVYSKNSISSRVLFVQIMVVVCLCINLMLILTFFMKELFYTTMRYILFAVTLLSDSLFLLMSDILLILNFFRGTMKTRYCIIIYIISSLYTFVTPVTLTVMVLERYVAICMPLRHTELCSTRNSLYLVLIIHGLSSLHCIVFISIFFAYATHNYYTLENLCSVETFFVQSWQQHLRSAMYQFYFLIMCIIIVFSYFKIMKVAKAASGHNKKSTWKALRTVILHAFQLLLCLIWFWCPFVEAAVLQINVLLYRNVRYFNYISFFVAPRCLSPLIYGLRDELFFQALKHLTLRGFYKKPLAFVR